MSKYYTPEIEEFHIGFEFETCLRNQEGPYWEKQIVEYKGWKDKWNIPPGKLSGHRVKYLDQEDIESLGFEKIEEPQSILEECYEKDGLVIQTNPFIHDKLPNKTRIGHRNKLRDGSGRYKGFYNYFQGTIKNKSELKKVLKMIGYEF